MSSVDQDRTQHAATVARMHNYYLGGHQNFPADQLAAETVIAHFPCIPMVARAGRAFLVRAVRYLLDAEVGQFVDIGCGVPGPGSVYDLVRDAPHVRTVCVDVDPVVVAETLEYLADDERTTAILGDLRIPEVIWRHPKIRRLLDLTQPIGLVLSAVLPFVPHDREAYDGVAQVVAALPSGSYVVISHGAAEAFPPDAEARAAVSRIYRRHTTAHPVARDRVGVQRFFTGLRMVGPGVVCAHDWHPDVEQPPPTPVVDRALDSGVWVGVGRKTEATTIGPAPLPWPDQNTLR